MPLTPSHSPTAPPGTPTASRRTATPQLIIGIFIMIAGLLIMADRLNLFALTGVLRYWPTVVITIGVAMLVQRSDPQGRFWGTVWTLLGGWLLLTSLGIVRVGLGDVFWPMVLIFMGVKLVMHARRYEVSAGGTAPPGTVSLFAVMGESKRINNDKPFRGGQMSAFMGGCQLDLRQAAIPAGGEAAIDVFSIMGGLEVWVPSNWAVVSHIVPIMGSVEDKRLPTAPVQGPVVETPPRLVLRGQIIMSGLTIKN
jgi:predicted membrane protein